MEIYQRKKIGKGLVGVISKDKAKVVTAMFSYDIFNLVVDLGSSLGMYSILEKS